MKRYRISEKAVADLLRISEAIARDNVTAAADWLDAVFDACQRAADFQHIGRARDELAAGLRSIPVGHYVMFYKPVDDELVLVVRLYHGAQDIPSIFEE